ncbi:hypothetical protein KDX31_01355 [Amphritea atlantica]|uniref:Uncharacterized protein n=1 Tax=Amphritea atlantica TaxID=355243 RepID=A0ABY5GUQ3_9GAMM|nr:hypothetical protein KDX31_01355 [Amphritea atlantica]
MRPVSRLLAIAFSVLFVGLSGAVLTGCDDNGESVAAPVVSVEQIDPADQQAFVRQMVGKYLLLSTELQKQYQAYKAAGDADGFVDYRNSSWTPEYIATKNAYEKVFYNQKAYIYRNQLDGLFDLFFALHKLSVHLKHSLLQKDWALEQQALQKLAQNQAEVNTYLLLAP